MVIKAPGERPQRAAAEKQPEQWTKAVQSAHA